MKKTALLAALLALAATGTLHAQMIYLANFNSSTQVPDGQNLSTSNGDLKGAISTTGGTGGTAADTISFDNSQYAPYGGNIGGYDSNNRVNAATATSLSNYVISFDMRASNLAPGTDATATPSVTIIRNFGSGGSTTLTGSPITLTSGYTHYSLNASTFTASNGNFATNITASDYDQTVFELLIGNAENPQGDLGSGAFNAGTSTIYIDNLAITQVAAAPEPKPIMLVGLGLALLGGVRVFRSRRSRA